MMDIAKDVVIMTKCHTYQQTVSVIAMIKNNCVKCGHFEDTHLCECDCHGVYYGDSRDDDRIEKN